MQPTTIAVDLAKSVFEVAVSHNPGHITRRHRFSRARFAVFLAQQEPACVVMEACGTAHYWGREAIARGHTVRLVAAEESPIATSLAPVLTEAADEIAQLDDRIALSERQLEALAKNSDVIQRLRTIPGVGLLTSTALLASFGDLQRFPSSRHFASALGLTPRESSSGSIRRLGRITKRGDPYVRMLLIHGARSVLHHAKRSEYPDRVRAWALGREHALGYNKANVALANKLARIIWAVWVRGSVYEPRP